MTILEELTQIVPTLAAEGQRRLLDLAIKLRDGRAWPDIALPDLDAGDDAWDVWSERVRARSARAMAEEARRLVALGILDEQGNVLTDELPADMRPSSRTSVET